MAETFSDFSCNNEAQGNLNQTNNQNNYFSKLVTEGVSSLINQSIDAADSVTDVISILPPSLDHMERFFNEKIIDAHQEHEPKDVEWLLAVDVKTENFGTHENIETRLKEYKELAKETKGKPIAIVLQVSEGDLEELKIPNPSLYSYITTKPYHIDQYIIYDGEFKKINSMNSAGLAEDVSKLLKFSDKHFNAERKALIIGSHGEGNAGLSGDTGSATTREFVSAIQNALPKNQKLDLIDFDSCLMAQNGVLDEVRKVTDNLVASAETEGGLGQEQDKIVRQLLKNPEMSPEELGQTIVEIARKPTLIKPEKPGKQKDVGDVLNWLAKLNPKGNKQIRDKVVIDTLSYFDLEKYGQFKTNLDSFGAALTEAIRHPIARQAIDDIVFVSQSYDSPENSYNQGSHVDLDQFVDKVLSKILEGKISDPDGKIRIAAGKVKDSHKQLVVAFSGFNYHGTKGGLSVYLPNNQFLDYKTRAKDFVPTSQFINSISEVPNLVTEKGPYVERLKTELSSINTSLEDNAEDYSTYRIKGIRETTRQAAQAIKALEKANDLATTFKALDDLKLIAENMKHSRFHSAELQESEIEQKESINEVYKRQMIDEPTGWDRFRDELRRLD